MWLEHLLSGAQSYNKDLTILTILVLAFLYKILRIKSYKLKSCLLIAIKLEAKDSLVAQLVRALH